MNKTELISKMMESTSLTKAQAQAALDAALFSITDSLKKGEPVQLTNFGTFKANERKARTGRNPQTGAKIDIPATTVATFSVGKELKETMRSASAAKVKKPAEKKKGSSKK